MLTYVSQEMRSILSEIHQAGVLHRDIRSWNLLVDESERISFADFDRASFHAKDDDYVKEKERLDKFIEGIYIDELPPIGNDDVRVE